MKTFVPRLAFLILTLVTLGSSPLRAQREKLPFEDLDIVEKKWPKAKRTYTGLRYIVLKKPAPGEDATPAPGMMVAVLYKGMLLNGKVFEETLDRNQPLRVRIGRGGLIDGWEEALQKMHRGEKWLLIVPAEMGYGPTGKPPAIPRQATLVFEMELIDFGKK